MNKEELKRMFSAQHEKFYNLKILKEHGFERRKCPRCGSYFWSLGKKTCGDTACEGGYKFIGIHDFGWDFLQAVEKWEKFFEKNYHRVIEPYPVVARWRDDLFFVIASIADFQPWVLKGIAEPPANPLVVSQPCLRFNDLDNVGRTGRHFTLFFMGGQHAFNMPNYWMNETVGFGLKFLTEVLKIPLEEITYREDVWIGGGNFGPCVEAFSHGLEIVNHVFMQFEEMGDGYREMNIRVVDTGWGLERIAWFASGKANAYEAVFPLLPKLREELGIDFDPEDEIWKEIGLYDVSEGVRLPVKVAKKLEALQRLTDLYAILDHTRALTFALADGAIPSNVGGGYNLRVLLRRVFAKIKKNGFELDVAELIREHARYLGKRFKNLRELPDVEDIIEVERKRYEESRRKARELVCRYIEKGILEEKLVELYESHGVPPEEVAAIASEKGARVKVPEDFYLGIQKKEKERKAGKRERDLPPTLPLYYSLKPEEEFEAKVLWVSGDEVVLDRTAFYPTAGGQIHDTGWLFWKNGKGKVVDVWKEGKAIVHRVKGDVPEVGMRVKGRIDAERRRAVMRHHTAVHIVNGAAVRVLGKHVWQAGAEKTPEKARLDITHYKGISREELKEIEREANRIVLQNLRIKKMELPRTEAEQKFGFRIYQGGAVPGAKLRVIQIPGHDAEACGGTHCDFTGEVGLIKITGAKRIQDGVVRLELVAGMRSLEKFWETEELVARACEKAKTEPAGLVKAIEKMERRIKELEKGRGVEIQLKGKEIKWAFVDLPYRVMENWAEKRMEEEEAEAIVLVNHEGGIFVISKGKISAVEIARRIAEEMGGNAGGNEKIARGGGKNVEKLKGKLEKILLEFLK